MSSAGTDTGEILSALSHISPDCRRDEWWPVLSAIKTALGDDGFSVADSWSSQASSYTPDQFRQTWRSLSPGHHTAATIFRRARDEGWTPDGNHKPIAVTRREPPPPEKPKTYDYAQELWAKSKRSLSDMCSHPYWVAKGIP